MAGPVCRIEEDGARLVRRMGMFWRESVALDDVVEIAGVSRDALTHEAIDVHFRTETNADFRVTEFDVGFRDVIAALGSRFPGLESWETLALGEAFVARERVLWRKASVL